MKKFLKSGYYKNAVFKFKQVIFILTSILTLLSILSLPAFVTSPVSASTLSNQVPWGARNNYNAFDGSGWDAFFNVSFPDFGPGVDIYQGSDGTSRPGPFPAPYPADPAAYFNGFTAGQTITFRTTITNTSSQPGRDNFWFSVSKVIACPGFNLSSPTLTEQNLYDCSVAGNRILTNQQLVFWSPSLTYHHPGCETGIDGKFCLNISNVSPNNTATLTYTWSPTETGYYQFDFGSDGYGHDYPGATAYAAGFIRVIPAPPPPPLPPLPGTKACSITSASAGSSSTESSISYNGWGSTATAEPVGLWVEKKVGNDTPISPAPIVNGFNILPTFDSINSKYYYRLDSPGDCNATSTISCSASKSVILPVGEYWTHCDLPTDPPAGKCSGNPFCTINGGTIDCSGFASCSAADFAELVITPNAPTINSLEVGNNPNRNTFTTTFEGSGRQTGPEGGKGWYNPMTVKLNAAAGSNPIKSYYVAFYDQKEGTGLVQPAYTSIIDPSTGNPSTSLKTLLQLGYNNGFVLRYDHGPPAAYYVWDPFLNNVSGDWKDISNISEGYSICGNNNGAKDCINQQFYITKAVNSAPTWQIFLFKDFGSKNMYTATYVIDNSIDKLSDYEADIIPQY